MAAGPAMQPDETDGAFFRRWRARLFFLRHTPLHPQWLVFRRRAQGLAEVAGLLRGVVLDVGCAHQELRPFLGTQVTYIGLDYPPVSSERYGTTADVYGDAGALPFASGVVDCVALLDVLEHLPEPERALREIARVLKRGGRLVLQVPFLYPLHDEPHDFQRWTIHGLHRILVSSGFRIVRESVDGQPAETAALLACLALAKTSLRLVRERPVALALVPFLVAAIPLVNLLARALSAVSPRDPLMPLGYRLCCERTA